jgi:Fe-S-cluster-containing dehydrogenase component
MAKYALIIDITRCNGCYNCQLACKDEHVDNNFPPYALAQPEAGHFWMRVVERERGQYPWVKLAYIQMTCMHCDEAPCIKKANDDAVYKRPDGIVIIDPKKAVGQKALVAACPYKTIYWNEEKNLPQKCTFCAHLLDNGWKEPRCVDSCPTQALIFGDIDDPNSEVSKLITSGRTEVLNPEYGTEPRVYYIGLPKSLIAGTAVFEDTNECAKGVAIRLTENSTGKSQDMVTNNYGDFEFDRLEIGAYSIEFRYEGYIPKTIEVDLKEGIYLGDIFLKSEL